MRSAICGIGMALAATTATAQDTDSANYMLPACKAFLAVAEHGAAPTNFARGVCAGMVAAIVFMAENSDVGITALSGVGQMQWAKAKWRCANIPKGVTEAQAVQVVVRYIEARPSRMHERFMSLALEAILDAWPCRD